MTDTASDQTTDEAQDTGQAEEETEQTAEPTVGGGGSDDPVEEIESDRRERLAPENRPANAEVDNTQRTFNTTTGKFEDSELDSDLGPFD